jgi:2-oxoglutarate/2-oxoacid ferredoxin oxidoreductase subunit beta
MAQELRTDAKVTWCPGCPNHVILESARRAFLSLMKQGYKKDDFAIVAGIGCHAKIFDYLDLSGFCGLHGRTLPTAMGIKMGNPNLKVVAFAGDGDCYSEGMEHFIHVGRFNPNMTLIVHDNQSFSLTTGQGTPTSQDGYKSKVEPLGKFSFPLNPIKLALNSEFSFVARANARDLDHTAQIIEKAVKHPGFSYVEILQDCLIFNTDMDNKDELMYKLDDKERTLKEAMEIADEWNYNEKKGKIALGVIFQEKRKTMEEQWPQLQNLMKNKVGWKNLKR